MLRRDCSTRQILKVPGPQLMAYEQTETSTGGLPTCLAELHEHAFVIIGRAMDLCICLQTLSLQALSWLYEVKKSAQMTILDAQARTKSCNLASCIWQFTLHLLLIVTLDMFFGLFAAGSTREALVYSGKSKSN